MSEGAHKTGRMRRILRILALRDPDQDYPEQVDPSAQRQRDIQKRIADEQSTRAAPGFFL